MCIDTSMWAYSTCSRVHIDKFAFIMREKVDFGDAARRSVYVLRKRVHRGVSFFLRTQWMSIFFTIYVYLTLPVGNLLAPPYNLSPILGLFSLWRREGKKKEKTHRAFCCRER